MIVEQSMLILPTIRVLTNEPLISSASSGKLHLDFNVVNSDGGVNSGKPFPTYKHRNSKVALPLDQTTNGTTFRIEHLI